MRVYLPSAPAPTLGPSEPHTGATARRGRTSPPTPIERPSRLPRSSPARGRKARTRKPNARAATRALTILLAEDEDGLRTAATRILRAVGYHVIEAENGEQALALAADTSIDVLVTDVMMPGVGGVQLAERLRHRHPAVRVVYMSGYPQTHLTSTGHLRGGHAFVEKPFTTEELQQAVERVMRSREDATR